MVVFHKLEIMLYGWESGDCRRPDSERELHNESCGSTGEIDKSDKPRPRRRTEHREGAQRERAVYVWKLAGPPAAAGARPGAGRILGGRAAARGVPGAGHGVPGRPGK